MPEAGRRAYDPDIDPVVRLFVDERITTARHMMRGEFAQAIADLVKQSSREHLEVRNDISVLTKAVNEIQLQDAHDDGRLEGKGSVTGTVWKAAGAVIAALGVLGAYISIVLN